MIKKLFLAIAMIMTFGMSRAADPSTTMTNVTKHGDAMVTYLEDDQNLEIVRMEYDLIFSTDNTKTLIRNLSKGYTYYFVAFADDRVEDLDLEIYRKTASGDWKLIDKDVETDNTPVLMTTVDQSGEYKIVVKAASFAKGKRGAHYGLIIAHD